MRVKVKRKERDGLEEEREDLLDLYVTLESYCVHRSHRRGRCVPGWRLQRP